MNANDIKEMFEGIDEDTKEIIARKLRQELSRAIFAVNAKLAAGGLTREDLSPVPSLTMNMFRLCKIACARVVILGQDPFIKPGEAQGMAFSVPKGFTIPPSLRNIYACLHHHGLIKEIPTHGDLTNWAKQGVLLLNCALTTELRKSNAHASEWEKYTDALLRELSSMPQPLIFILLGGFAQAKAGLIDRRRHIVLEWGHPSPLNSANKSDNPKNFKYCDVFTRANDSLICRGLPPINWDPNFELIEPVLTLAQFTSVLPKAARAEPETISFKDPVYSLRESSADDPAPLTSDTLWIFTDGGSKGNGKEHCNASWAFYITDGCVCVEAYGLVEEKEIPGVRYKASNNRGELTAIQRALEFTANYLDKFSFEQIILVSDSEYSINCLNVWAPQWLANPAKHNLQEKKNLDIIVPACESLEEVRSRHILTFRHIRSHRNEPGDSESEDWFLWKCNDIVDRLCNVALGRIAKK